MWENTAQDRHYAGDFVVETDAFSGEIVYNKENGIIILSLTKELQGVGKSYGRQKFISGKLNSGAYVTLCNCQCIKNLTHNFSVQQLRFRADCMIWGKAESANRKFNKFVCVLENGLQWSGLTQIYREDFTKIAFKKLSKENSYNWFGANVNFSTKLDMDVWHSPRPETCRIEEHLQIEIVSEEKQDVDYFLQIRNKVMSMISFAIKDNVNIDSQSFYDFDDSYMLTEEIKQYNEYMLFTNEQYHILRKTNLHNYNFKLCQLPQDSCIADSFVKLEPVFNLYLSLFKYNDMPAEMVFLNIVQAIETFHSRFFYDNKKKKYIESVYNRFGSLVHFDQIKQLLLNDTQMDENCNYILLVSRLNDLFIGKFDGLFFDFYGTDNQYAQRIADTRHYYTHYGKSKESKALKGNDLLDAIEILTLLLEYNVCLALGIDNRNKTANRLGSYSMYKQMENTN